ncbi:DUF975 family protein [Bacteroidia bacterium]|jgi:uncharacterized membrane protein|nr:DUF975 family protein [Bacteroidia bacterium]
MKYSITISNLDLISQGKDKAGISWGQAIVGSLVMMVVSAMSGFIPFGSLVLGAPLVLGYSIWALKIVREDDFKVDHIFDGFKNFGNSLATYLLRILLILLWTLLFIIPGIIKGLAYSQAMFILADEPEIGPMDALKKSEAMMNGNKTKLFLLGLIFALLSVACVFTLGIGFLFLLPVMQITLAKFYDEVKMNYTGEDRMNEIEQIGVGE